MSEKFRKAAFLGLIVLLVAVAVPQDIEEPDTCSPTLEQSAKGSVDNFLRAYQAGGIDTAIKRDFWLVYDLLNYAGILAERHDTRVVKPLIELLKDTTRFDDDTHSIMAAALGWLGDTTAVPVLKGCLKRTTREFTRLEAGIALCLLGELRTGLPVVEEYAKREEPPYSENFGGGAVTNPFFTGTSWAPIELPNKEDDKALVRYFERVLTYPSEENRIYAIVWLLQKDGANKELAYQAAIDIIENTEPRPYMGRNRKWVLSILKRRGGERGKAIAAEYEK